MLKWGISDYHLLFLGTEQSLKNSLIMAEQFGSFSGLRLNKRKTEALWLGCWKYRRKILANVQWKLYPENTIKILGVHFKNDCRASNVSENWTSKLSKMEGIMKSWMMRNLTILGKITLVKSFLASQFIYIMQGLILPQDVLTRINTLLFKYIWNSKHIYKESDLKKKVVEKVKRSTLIQDYSKGGLNIIDVRDL